MHSFQLWVPITLQGWGGQPRSFGDLPSWLALGSFRSLKQTLKRGGPFIHQSLTRSISPDSCFLCSMVPSGRAIVKWLWRVLCLLLASSATVPSGIQPPPRSMARECQQAEGLWPLLTETTNLRPLPTVGELFFFFSLGSISLYGSLGAIPSLSKLSRWQSYKIPFRSWDFENKARKGTGLLPL